MGGQIGSDWSMDAANEIFYPEDHVDIFDPSDPFAIERIFDYRQFDTQHTEDYLMSHYNLIWGNQIQRRSGIARPPSRSPSHSRSPGPSLPAPPPEASETPVDLRALEYASAVDDNLMCAICHSPFVDPVRLPCEHIFCRECLQGALDHGAGSRKCPSCRQRIGGSKHIIPAPKIIKSIVDDLRVKCPNGAEPSGCRETMARSAVQHHVDLYCSHTEVDCALESCRLKIKRCRASSQCQHRLETCPHCQDRIMILAMADHISSVCRDQSKTCEDCQQQVGCTDYEEHIRNCLEGIVSCAAAKYGCTFTSKRGALFEHTSECPLNTLVPFLELQQARLDEHEEALRHLKRKAALYERSFAGITETLGLSSPSSSSSSTAWAPAEGASQQQQHAGRTRTAFDSTASQLLEMHESLRQQVGRVSMAVSELDAKTDMTFLNASVREKEDMAHLNAVVNQLRIQMQWLMSSRAQSQQREASLARNQAGAEAGGSAAAAGARAAMGLIGWSRSLSDSARPFTKL